MKKLMIVAAAAAMAGAVFADAQVYDIKLKVKTTQCKEAKFTKALEKLGWFGSIKAGTKVSFRGSATRKMGGVIWGCDCDTISRPSWRVENGGLGVGGYAFWDETKAPYTPFQIPWVTFDWAVLNRVGKMTNVEGSWILGDKAAGEAFYFLGAGFGTCTLNSNDCASYIKTMSGNFAGFRVYNYTQGDGCIFCGETFSSCLVAPFCVCLGGVARNTSALTVAYGSWQLKYNSSQSKKLVTKAFITEVRNCTSAKVANIGAALDAAYAATQQAAAAIAAAAAVGADVDISKMQGKPTVTKTVDVASKDLADKGSYYTHLSQAKAEYKNAKLDVKNPGIADLTQLPSVAGAMINSLDHVESAADAGDAGDDWGDSGDDWGDDDGGDDWDF